MRRLKGKKTGGIKMEMEEERKNEKSVPKTSMLKMKGTRLSNNSYNNNKCPRQRRIKKERMKGTLRGTIEKHYFLYKGKMKEQGFAKRGTAINRKRDERRKTVRNISRKCVYLKNVHLFKKRKLRSFHSNKWQKKVVAAIIIFFFCFFEFNDEFCVSSLLKKKAKVKKKKSKSN